jgi:hypothetical protein
MDLQRDLEVPIAVLTHRRSRSVSALRARVPAKEGGMTVRDLRASKGTARQSGAASPDGREKLRLYRRLRGNTSENEPSPSRTSVTFPGRYARR